MYTAISVTGRLMADSDDICNIGSITQSKIFFFKFIVREKIRKDTSTEFEGEMEIVSEGGTLYRDVKENGLGKTAHILE